MAEIELRIDRWPEGLAQIRAALEALTAHERASGEVVGEMILALEELVANVFEHGTGGEVVLRLACDAGKIDAEIVDSGPAFNPLTLADPDLEAGIEERSIGGLGIFLVKTLMDRVHYRRSEAHNHIYLTKRLAPDGGREQAQEPPRR